MSKLEVIKKIIKDANLSEEQHKKLHRLLRDDIINQTMVDVRKTYNEEALKRGVKTLSLEV